jgi:hypothetical protein
VKCRGIKRGGREFEEKMGFRLRTVSLTLLLTAGGQEE